MQATCFKYSRALALATTILVSANGCSMPRPRLPQMPQRSHSEIRVSPQPTLEPRYEFLQTHPTFAPIYEQLYNPSVDAPSVNVAITFPTEGTLQFNGRGNRPLRLHADTEIILSMVPGVYPFQVFPAQGRRASLSGAMLVYNVDSTLALATLGKTEQTRIFNVELSEKAAQGILTTYTVHFDGKPVLTYFLGNRMSQFAGGDAIVELDFSANTDISQLRVNGENLTTFRPALPLFNVVTDAATGNVRLQPTEYSFTMISAGNAYRGIIRLNNANESTAFVGVNCRIPDDLLESARQGTVARYSIKTENGQQIAEIMIRAR